MRPQSSLQRPHIHPFIYTFIHQCRLLPCKALPNPLGANIGLRVLVTMTDKEGAGIEPPTFLLPDNPIPAEPQFGLFSSEIQDPMQRSTIHNSLRTANLFLASQAEELREDGGGGGLEGDKNKQHPHTHIAPNMTWKSGWRQAGNCCSVAETVAASRRRFFSLPFGPRSLEGFSGLAVAHSG